MSTFSSTLRIYKAFSNNRYPIPQQIMQSDLNRMWEFLAPKGVLKRDNNIDYLQGIKSPCVPNLTQPTDDEINNCDLILALGSNDLSTPKQAAKLYDRIKQTNPEIKIIASGKGGHTTVPSEISVKTIEAEAYKDHLIKCGVPSNNILVEPKSTNSGDNIKFSYDIISSMNFIPKRVIIVQTPAAQLRANLSFEKQWGNNDWQYYISFPPELPNIKSLSIDELNYYLSYALRESFTTLKYILDGKFLPRFDFSSDILNLMCKYAGLFMNQIANEDPPKFFRDLFEIEEKPLLKP